MKKYRRKPVVVEAIQYRDNGMGCLHDIYDFMNIIFRGGFSETGKGIDDDGKFKITTLEGVMVANIGDWIIKGVKGEFYPCKDEIFKLTYECIGEVKK